MWTRLRPGMRRSAAAGLMAVVAVSAGCAPIPDIEEAAPKVSTVDRIDFEPLLDKVIEERAASELDLCITVEVEGDPDAWIEVTWDLLNMSYPLAGPPAESLPAAGLAIPEYLEVAIWDEGVFVTFEHPGEPVAGISSFLAAYFETILGTYPESIRYRVTEKHL